MASSNCLGPCPMRSSALEITVTSWNLSTVMTGREAAAIRIKEAQMARNTCPRWILASPPP